MSQSSEEQLIQRYFAAFNRHDLDAVLACFHQDAIIVGSDGSRYDGLDAVRSLYAERFAITPGGRCDLRSVAAADGKGDAESRCSRAREPATAAPSVPSVSSASHSWTGGSRSTSAFQN